MTHPTFFQQLISWMSFIFIALWLVVMLAGGIERIKNFFSGTVNVSVEQDVKQLYVNADPTAPADNLAAATQYLGRHNAR